MAKQKIITQGFKHFIALVVGLLILSACSTKAPKETVQTKTPSQTSATQNQTESQQNKQHISVSLAPLSAWTERRFAGSTDYSIIRTTKNKTAKDKSDKEPKSVLIAKSQDTASLLFKKMSVNLNETPYLNWQWKVKGTYKDNLHENQKKGDDFPARVYIAIKPTLGQFKPRALTYVWASHAKALSHWKNPFTNNVEVFALQSGDALTGNWITEKRNLKEDLTKFFGQSIESIEGIGIMTDTDNSNTSGEAAYSNLFFSRN